MIRGMTTTNAQRAEVKTAGDYFIGFGMFVAVVSVLLGIFLAFVGGNIAVFGGVIPGLLLMSVGYLKRISVALIVQQEG